MVVLSDEPVTKYKHTTQAYPVSLKINVVGALSTNDAAECSTDITHSLLPWHCAQDYYVVYDGEKLSGQCQAFL